MLTKIIIRCSLSFASVAAISLLTLLGCHKDSVTSNSFVTITGTVTLESATSLSGVTIQVYPLATTDADVQAIHQNFSTVGTRLSQATEFDHRLVTPVASTTTSADGSFRLTVNPGTYNIVAVQDGYGYSYKLEVAATSGTVSAGSMTLLKEQELSTISTSTTTPVVFDAGRHYIIRNTVYISCLNADVLVKAGAVFKFDDGATLNILQARSFQVTGQDGTPVIFTALNQTGVVAKWNTVLVASQVPVTMQYAVISNATTGINSNAVSFVATDIVLSKNSSYGMVFSHQSADSIQVILSRLIVRDGGGLNIGFAKASSISKSIFARCGKQGIYANHATTVTIQDNYFRKSGSAQSVAYNSDSSAIYTSLFNGIIQNNTFELNGIAICTANGSMPLITSNEFEKSTVDVLITNAGGNAGGLSSQPTLNQNNFIGTKGSAVANENYLDITATSNFWDTLDSSTIANVKIVDGRSLPSSLWSIVNYVPFLTTKYAAAGIRP